MKLVFLGTSAAQPTPERGLTCICLEKEGQILMFDAGEGAQISYLKSGLGWNKKMKIFVTHLHGDHCIGILGLLQTMTLQNRTEPMEIYGPDGIEEFIADKAKELGVPEGELWHKLQTGQDIQVEDKIVKSSDVLGEKRPGKRIGISGGTRQTKKLEVFFKHRGY